MALLALFVALPGVLLAVVWGAAPHAATAPDSGWDAIAMAAAAAVAVAAAFAAVASAAASADAPDARYAAPGERQPLVSRSVQDRAPYDPLATVGTPAAVAHLSRRQALCVAALADSEHELVRGLALTVAPQENVEFATHTLACVAALDDAGSSHALDLVAAVVADAAATAPSATVLFRGNTASTKLLSLFARRAAVPDYLTAVLAPHIAAITAPGVSFEYQEHREESAERRAANIEALGAAASRILDAVIATPLPPLLALAFQRIVAALTPHFPADVDTVSHNAGCSLVFLRLIVPAIVTPELYELAETRHPAVASRNLVLVAQFVQTAANRVLSTKNAALLPLNPLLESYFPRIRAWYDAVLAEPVVLPPQAPVAATPLELDSLDYLLGVLDAADDALAARLAPSSVAAVRALLTAE